MTKKTVAVAAVAIALAALAWIDPLYLPLVALGPVVSGVAAGAAGAEPRTLGVTWFAAGMLVLVSDLAVNGEDAGFHAGVALITAGLAAACCAAGRRLSRRTQAV